MHKECALFVREIMESNPPSDTEYEEKNDGFPDSPEMQDALKKITERSNVLFTGGIDFVKWTTTLSVAAIVWIAATFNPQEHRLNHFSELAVIFLIISIIVAIFIVYFILSYWAEQVESSLNLLRFLITREEKYRKILGLTGANMVYFKYAHLESEKKLFRFRRPEDFSSFIVIHMIFLVGGLLFYAASIYVT